MIDGIGPLTGKGIGVAVIDSGVANMPEFGSRIIATRDFTDDRGTGLDKNGHGTHVAGIIAAAGRNPFDETAGVAPGANIISLKVLDAKGRGFAGDVIEAIYWAIEAARSGSTPLGSSNGAADRPADAAAFVGV